MFGSLKAGVESVNEFQHTFVVVVCPEKCVGTSQGSGVSRKVCWNQPEILGIKIKKI